MHQIALVSCLAFSLALKMEAIYSSDTSLVFQWTTWRYIPEDVTLHNHRCKNLRVNEILSYVPALLCFWNISNCSPFVNMMQN
jgi:hypothetical protein